MKPKHRLTLQLSIIATTLWLMAGCFYLPAKDKAADGTSLPNDLIGPPGSGKPLLLHQSTRDDVNHVLPNALSWSADRRFALYTYYVRTGYTVWPLCFYASPEDVHKYLQLRFTPDGRLDGFDLFDNWQWATKDTGITHAPPYTPAPRPPTTTPLTPDQQRVIQDHLTARRQAETRPSPIK